MRDLAVITVFIVILSMHVYYDKDVKVVIEYNLDENEKFGAYLFGMENVRDDVLSIFKSKSYEVERIDYNTAVIKFKTEHFNNYWFFDGVKLEYPVNMTLHVSDYFYFNITSDEIPQAYIFE